MTDSNWRDGRHSDRRTILAAATTSGVSCPAEISIRSHSFRPSYSSIVSMVILPLVALIIAAFASPVMGQEHSHDGTLGKFYERWMMPGPRTVSCCNKQDCAPVEHVRRLNGELQFQRKRDGQWLTIPPDKLESNFDDAYDSPDGFSHMCSNFDNVYCAVLGSGI